MKKLVLLALAAFLMSLLSSVWAADPVVVYLFNEGSGSVVHDSGPGAALDLTAADPGNISWIPGGGLSINDETILISDGPATKVIDACMASNEITIEAWYKPANDTQGGPARIVSVSFDGSFRNFSYTQDGAGHEVRLRTTTSGDNGTNQRIQAPNTIVTDRMMKGVYSRDTAGNAILYIDGTEVASTTVGGDFSNWDPSYQIMLANEVAKAGDREWTGELYYVAIYAEALMPDELLPPTAVEPEYKVTTTWAGIKAAR
jgi:hypothetical protein